MYRIAFTPEASRQLRKLDKRYSGAVSKALERIAKDPKLGEPLRYDLKGYWKLRFSRYRIVYKIYERKLLVIIFDIDHRKKVYK